MELSIPGDISFTIECDIANKLIMKATVPENKWLGIAWGSDMDNTDATWFSGSGTNGVVKDLWMTGKMTPSEDISDDITVISSVKEGSNYKFEVEKPYDSGDAQDKAIHCGSSYFF